MTLPAIDLVDGPVTTERGAYWVVCADIDGARWDACWADDLHGGATWGAEIFDSDSDSTP